MWFGVSTMGRLRRVERAGGDHDVGLRFADGAGDDVQLAGGGVVLRERCEGATLAGEVDRAQCVECRAQLEGGEVIAERERRAAEGDDVVDIHLWAGGPAAIRHGPTWAHLDRVDNAPRPDPEEPAGQGGRNEAAHVDVDVVRGLERRAGRTRA